MARITKVLLAATFLIFSAHAAELLVRHAPLTALQLMANDKESKSVIAKSQNLGDLETLKPRLTEIAAGLAPQIFDQAATACELNTLTQLKTLAAAQGFPAETKEDLKSVLSAMRGLDLVDDVVLAPLWKSLPAFERTPVLPQPSNGTEINATAVNAADASTELNRARSLFAGMDRLCPTQVLVAVSQKLKKELGNSYRITKLRKEAKKAMELQVISPELYAWLNDLEDERFEEVPFTLSSVAQTLKSVKNSYLAADAQSGKTDLASMKKKKTHGLSYRLAFYQKYNATQIDLMAKAFYHFNRNMGARRVSIVTDFNGDGTDVETEQLSNTEQYRWAENRLHKEYADVMARSDIFQGQQIEFEDIVLAGLETGYIPANTINDVMKIDDRWNPPEEKGFRKVMNIVTKYGGPLLILVPPPFNMISSVAMALVQSTVLKKTERADPLQEGYSIF